MPNMCGTKKPASHIEQSLSCFLSTEHDRTLHPLWECVLFDNIKQQEGRMEIPRSVLLRFDVKWKVQILGKSKTGLEKGKGS